MSVETVTRIVKIADADGTAIHVGSVLKNIKDGERGVVVRIVKAGDRGTVFDSVGDLNLYMRPGITRVTNNYNQWRHIDHNDQTYDERFNSWLVSPVHYDPEYSSVSKEEATAVSGIMALLPDNIVDNDYDPIPTRTEDALRFLLRHLETLNERRPTTR